MVNPESDIKTYDFFSFLVATTFLKRSFQVTKANGPTLTPLEKRSMPEDELCLRKRTGKMILIPTSWLEVTSKPAPMRRNWKSWEPSLSMIC